MIPFLVADLDGCNDISNCVGSTATGVIDPARNAWYVTTKTYADQTKSNAQGLLAGRYWIHALDVITLDEKPGFPVPLEGIAADNAPWRVFEGGKHHQRPAMIQINDWIYAGFASHCVQYNFTGKFTDKKHLVIRDRFLTGLRLDHRLACRIRRAGHQVCHGRWN
jgi:hypothetical protein